LKLAPPHEVVVWHAVHGAVNTLLACDGFFVAWKSAWWQEAHSMLLPR
jgi:hypothetical protein